MTTPDHPQYEAALYLLAQGQSVNAVRLALRIRHALVSAWAKGAEPPPLGKPPCRPRTLTDVQCVDLIARERCGESIEDLAIEVGHSPAALADRLTRLRSMAAQVADAERGRATGTGPRSAASLPQERHAPPLPRWLRELAPTGRRVELTLADDGMGDVRLIAAVQGPAGLMQESWPPTAFGDWPQRLLMHLGGAER